MSNPNKKQRVPAPAVPPAAKPASAEAAAAETVAVPTPEEALKAVTAPALATTPAPAAPVTPATPTEPAESEAPPATSTAPVDETRLSPPCPHCGDTATVPEGSPREIMTPIVIEGRRYGQGVRQQKHYCAFCGSRFVERIPGRRLVATRKA